VQEPGDQPAAGARTAFIEDPDGHVVELVQPLED
jgi:lactoylglutathione lyase